MNNVVTFDQSKRKSVEDGTRWKIVLIYAGANGELERKIVQIEELEELQDIVEHGPDWNELVIGTITLQRRLEALPTRANEQLQTILSAIDSNLV